MQVCLISEGECQITVRTYIVDRRCSTVSLCLSRYCIANDSFHWVKCSDSSTITILTEGQNNLCLARSLNREAAACWEVPAVIVVVCSTFADAEVLMILRIECLLCEIVGLDATRCRSVLDRCYAGINANVAIYDISRLNLNLTCIYPSTELLS